MTRLLVASSWRRITPPGRSRLGISTSRSSAIRFRPLRGRSRRTRRSASGRFRRGGSLFCIFGLAERATSASLGFVIGSGWAGWRKRVAFDRRPARRALKSGYVANSAVGSSAKGRAAPMEPLWDSPKTRTMEVASAGARAKGCSRSRRRSRWPSVVNARLATTSIPTSARPSASGTSAPCVDGLADRRARDTIPLGRDRTLRVIEIRPAEDGEPVLVVEPV